MQGVTLDAGSYQPSNQLLFKLIEILSFASLTALGSTIFIILPFTPVPITGQTFFVLLSGYMLEKKKAALSQFTYILFGILGVPWFAQFHSGINILLGATGGYLLGFVFASYFVGLLNESRNENNRLINIFYSLIVGTLIIYVLGITGLIIFAGLNLNLALQLGFYPFIPGDIFKITLILFIASIYNSKMDTNNRNKILLGFNLTLVILVIFIFYLFSNNAYPPMYLPIISAVTSILICIVYLVIHRS